jgi:hypothetical protein
MPSERGLSSRSLETRSFAHRTPRLGPRELVGGVLPARLPEPPSARSTACLNWGFERRSIKTTRKPGALCFQWPDCWLGSVSQSLSARSWGEHEPKPSGPQWDPQGSSEQGERQQESDEHQGSAHENSEPPDPLGAGLGPCSFPRGRRRRGILPILAARRGPGQSAYLTEVWTDPRHDDLWLGPPHGGTDLFLRPHRNPTSLALVPGREDEGRQARVTQPPLHGVGGVTGGGALSSHLAWRPRPRGKRK